MHLWSQQEDKYFHTRTIINADLNDLNLKPNILETIPDFSRIKSHYYPSSSSRVITSVQTERRATIEIQLVFHDTIKSPKILSLDRILCQFYPLCLFRNVYPMCYPPIAMSTFYVADI